MPLPRFFCLLFLTILPVAFAGCGRSSTEVSDPGVEAVSVETHGAAVHEEEGVEAEVLLEPFDAPPLVELEARVEWIDHRVVDPLKDRRAEEAGDQPLVSVADALRMRNDSMDANAKILGALGRVPSNESEVDWDATIVRRLTGDVKSTNPVLYSSVAEVDVLSLTAIEFFGFDDRLVPLAYSSAVKSWQSSTDGMYDKLVIRDDLTWSDGRPITGHDFVFSFKTIMNPKVPIPAVRAGMDQVRWIEAYDDQTIVYFHKQASPINIWNVNFPVIPQHVYEKSLKEDATMQTSEYHVAQESNPVTGGPYVIAKWARGQELVLQRRDSYFFHEGKQVRPLRHFKEVRFRVISDPNTALLALRSGEVEETEINAEQWLTEQTKNAEFYETNTKVTGTEWVEFHFNWNIKTPYFADKRVRWAMAYAFDHEEMLDKLFYGLYEPAAGPFHPESWMAPKDFPEPIRQDLDKAEDLLDDAGWDDSDGDGIRDIMVAGKLVPFEFSVACAQSPVSVKVCEQLHQDLDKIGIVCHVKPMEPTVLQQITLDHKFHAAFGGWSAGAYPDTSINIFGTGEDRNFGQFSNKEVDDLFQQGRKEFDREKRAAIYARIHEILWEEQPYMWLYYRNSFYGFNKSLRGYKFSPRGPFHYSPGFDAVWKAAD